MRSYMVSFDRPIAPLGQWPIVWEVPLIRFLEREGYDLSYQTDVDTHLSPASLLDHQLVMTSGHDEYWTKEMRDGFDVARDHGTNLAFMGANNGYWQLRYQDGTRTLAGYTGPSGNAKAVKYTAQSGARVFASGSLQFAWGLDNFATEEEGHAYPADPRLQQFMRNALADLTRPAALGSVTPTVTGTVVHVALAPDDDPRIRDVVVYRHEGADPFALSAGVQVCRGALSAPCAELEPAGHRTYRYAAVVDDEWGQSAANYSAPLVLPDTPPAVRLSGPRRARRGARVTFTARASDRDGDT